MNKTAKAFIAFILFAGITLLFGFIGSVTPYAGVSGACIPLGIISGFLSIGISLAYLVEALK